MRNEMKMEFSACSSNEGFARVAVGAFIAALNPTIDELDDVKTAVSEAVTNAIIHGYDEQEGKVWILCEIRNGEEVEPELEVSVIDIGAGIEDIEKARTPLFTTKPEFERSGMGFAFMEAFMDEVWVSSALGKGTTVTMKKKFGRA